MSEPAGNIAVFLRRFAGLIAIVFGVLFAAFGGLCSAIYLLSFYAEGDWNNLGAALMVGVPTAVVAGMIVSMGRRFWAKR